MFSVETPAYSCVVGLVIDARGRPIAIPTDQIARVAKLQEWLRAFGLPIMQE